MRALVVGAVMTLLVPAALQGAQDLSRTTPSVVPEQSVAGPARSGYLLGPDDVIVLQVLDIPDLNGKTLRVDPTGDLRMPIAGRIHAAGMTVEELEAEIAKRLRVFLNEPDVSVTVNEFHSQSVSIIGSVRSPGVQQIQGHKTLVELLSMAGGTSPEAGPVVRVMRRAEWQRIPLTDATVDPQTGVSVVDIDLRDLLTARSPERNIVILPNDVISISRADVVYVVGEVNRAGAVPLSRGNSVTVLEALSASGGLLRTAAPTKARVLRLNEITQVRAEIEVNLQKMMQGKVKDLALLSGDILVVPDSSGKRITARAVEAILQMGTIVGTYGVLR